MIFTPRMKRNGELAVRTMSEKARTVYEQTPDIIVFEYEDADGETTYAVHDIDGIHKDLTLDQAQALIEMQYVEYDEED